MVTVQMLYPDFNELVALKNRKSRLIQPSRRAVQSTISGNHHSPFRGQGLDFDSVREYVPGDEIRRIDWRVTARTGFPHIKLFREDRERQIVLCVDMNATMRFGTRKTFKSIQAAQVAAFLGWQGIASQDRVSGCLFGDVPNGIQFFAPNRTKRSFCALLKMLSEPPHEQHQTAWEEVLFSMCQMAHPGSLIYLISDFLSMRKEGVKMSQLRKQCDLVFIAINDQADKSIPPLGWLGCRDRKDKISIDTDNAIGREAYAAQWKESRERLDEITTKFKIPLIQLTTESELQHDLAWGLKRIAKRKNR